MRTIRNTFTIVAARGSPESTGRGEISRAEVVAEAEATPLTIDTPELRRLSVENAWRFDADTLEIECRGAMARTSRSTTRLVLRTAGAADWSQRSRTGRSGCRAQARSATRPSSRLSCRTAD